MSAPAATPTGSASARTSTGASAAGSKLKPPGVAVGSSTTTTAIGKKPGHGSGGGASTARSSSGDAASGEKKNSLPKSTVASLNTTGTIKTRPATASSSAAGAAGAPSAAASSGAASAAAPGAAVVKKVRPTSALAPRGSISGAAGTSLLSSTGTPASARVGASSSTSAAAARTRALGSTLAAPSATGAGSRRPSTASAHLRSPSAVLATHSRLHSASSAGGGSGSSTLGANDGLVATLQIQVAALQSSLDEKSLALTKAEDELSNLRLSTSETAARKQIHVLEGQLKNLQQVLQAQREGVEGSLGFVPAATQPRTNMTSLREKKYEENIQDLSFQMLYGDTGKDVQLAKANELLLAEKHARAQDRLEMAKLRRELEESKERKVEIWLQSEAFLAVM